MDTRIIKIIIAALSLAYTVMTFIDGSWITGIFMLLVTTVLVLVCFRSTRLIVVFYYIQRQNLEKAKTWLAKINPNKLWNNQKGYYHFLLATTDMQNQSMAQSEKHLRTALQFGLRMDHDKAAVYLNLSVLAANKRKKREAMMHLTEAKKYDTKGYLKKDIKEVQKMLNSI
jgi:tetratricopeptide (TPR) repeat protein